MTSKRNCLGPLAWLLLAAYGVATVAVFFLHRSASIWMFLGFPWMIPAIFLLHYRRFLMPTTHHPRRNGWVKIRGTAAHASGASLVRAWSGSQVLAYLMRVRRRNAGASAVVAMEFRSQVDFVLRTSCGNYRVPNATLDYYFSGMQHRFLCKPVDLETLNAVGEILQHGGVVRNAKAESRWRDAFAKAEATPNRALHWVFLPVPVEMNIAFSEAVVEENEEYTIIAHLREGEIDATRTISIFDSNDTERWIKTAILVSAIPAFLVSVGIGFALLKGT